MSLQVLSGESEQGQTSTCRGRSKPTPEGAEQGSGQKLSSPGISGQSVIACRGVEEAVLTREDRARRRVWLVHGAGGSGSGRGSEDHCSRRRTCWATLQGVREDPPRRRPLKASQAKGEQTRAGLDNRRGLLAYGRGGWLGSGGSFQLWWVRKGVQVGERPYPGPLAALQLFLPSYPTSLNLVDLICKLE